MGDAAATRARIQPLVAWIKQNASRLKAEGRWPLRQADVPAELHDAWHAFRRDKPVLQQHNQQQHQEQQQQQPGQQQGTPKRQAAGAGYSTQLAHPNERQLLTLLCCSRMRATIAGPGIVLSLPQEQQPPGGAHLCASPAPAARPSRQAVHGMLPPAPAPGTRFQRLQRTQETKADKRVTGPPLLASLAPPQAQASRAPPRLACAPQGSARSTATAPACPLAWTARPGPSAPKRRRAAPPLPPWPPPRRPQAQRARRTRSPPRPRPAPRPRVSAPGPRARILLAALVRTPARSKAPAAPPCDDCAQH